MSAGFEAGVTHGRDGRSGAAIKAARSDRLDARCTGPAAAVRAGSAVRARQRQSSARREILTLGSVQRVDQSRAVRVLIKFDGQG